ncbi:oxygenase MpaB family protein [Parvularcula maris]|uniref:Oxygenase MpaB family protein n=1 Tax=Parvularcula maris TaxID=2965077 RepID=A0A9X2L9G1_9PROT|nr:oxygenase MpaB family protein [Parvularcula maris]
MTLFIGGVAAVILELAEPRVRHGVWDHSVFPADPVLRLRRTGLAAMVSFYAPRSKALTMIEGINRRHARIEGLTDSGKSYRADDPELLLWVQATAAYGFIKAYSRFVRRLNDDDWERALTEAQPVAEAYGVATPPLSKEGLRELLQALEPRLEPSETLQTFLRMMRDEPALPGVLSRLQPLLVRAAVGLVPPSIRRRTGIDELGPRPGESALLNLLARGSTWMSLRNHPRELARRRLASKR